MTDRAYLPYLKTLRRIPPEVILSMATREFDMDSGPSCLCGWAWREQMLATIGEDPYYDTSSVSASSCCLLFGGTGVEWVDLYFGVTAPYRWPAIEEAFARRVEECCRG